MTLVLHQAPPAFGASSMSPFCIKLECWLRMAGIEYRSRDADYRKAPKGKIPFIELDGRYIGDSELIIRELVERHGDRVDGHLGAAERAEAHLARRMLEEGTYFVGVYARWIDDAGWAAFEPHFRAIFPRPLFFMPALIRRQVKKALRAQGIARHAPEEIYAFGIRDADALVARLGDGPFYFGAQPSSIDCTAYAQLELLLSGSAENPLKRHVAGIPRAVAYRRVMRERYFPELGPPA